TEAGDGEDGRIKSAIGIGALLDDGIGDTVRVSLTEDPVEEVPVARRLVERYNRLLAGSMEVASSMGAGDPPGAPPGVPAAPPRPRSISIVSPCSARRSAS